MVDITPPVRLTSIMAMHGSWAASTAIAIGHKGLSQLEMSLRYNRMEPMAIDNALCLLMLGEPLIVWRYKGMWIYIDNRDENPQMYIDRYPADHGEYFLASL